MALVALDPETKSNLSEVDSSACGDRGELTHLGLRSHYLCLA